MFANRKQTKKTTMITLITLLISLLGYGTPADFQNLTEDQLFEQVEMANTEQDGGIGDPWEHPDVQSPTP